MPAASRNASPASATMLPFRLFIGAFRPFLRTYSVVHADHILKRTCLTGTWRTWKQTTWRVLLTYGWNALDGSMSECFT
jgi:hypothetical protein